MLSPAPYFCLDQLGALPAAQTLFQRATGLTASLVMMPMGQAAEPAETIEIIRPRAPNAPLWFIQPTEGGRAIVVDAASGEERAAASAIEALLWVAQAELGECVQEPSGTRLAG